MFPKGLNNASTLNKLFVSYRHFQTQLIQLLRALQSSTEIFKTFTENCVRSYYNNILAAILDKINNERACCDHKLNRAQPMVMTELTSVRKFCDVNT